MKTATQDSAKPLDHRLFKGDWLDPMEIYGFSEFVNGEATELRDHPEFPNPRSKHNMDEYVVTEIEATGVQLEPIKVYWHSDGTVVLADGKTRMTGEAKYLRRNPDMVGKVKVPIQRLRGTANEIRLLMLQYNLRDSRRPLTDADISKYLRDLDSRGVSSEEQLKVLDRSGRKGLIWLNHMKQILDANPVVVDAYEKGDIEFTTAKVLSKAPFKDQSDILEKVLELKRENPNIKEAEIRKAVGVKRANRTTMGFDATLDFFIKDVYAPNRQALHPTDDRLEQYHSLARAVEAFVAERGSTALYQEMLAYNALRDQLEHFMWFLKAPGQTVGDFESFIADNMTDHHRELLDGSYEDDHHDAD